MRKNADLILHVGKRGVCSGAAGRAAALCPLVPGIAGAAPQGARQWSRAAGNGAFGAGRRSHLVAGPCIAAKSGKTN